MAKRAGGIPRAIAMKMIPGAIKAGFSATGFLEYLKKQGLGYRRTIFLADWRSALGISQVEGLLKYVRKSAYPSERFIIERAWAIDEEFMYVFRVKKALGFPEPKKAEFVSILSDKPLTVGEAETKAWTMIFEQSPKRRIEISSLSLEEINRRKLPVLEEE